MKKETFETGY